VSTGGPVAAGRSAAGGSGVEVPAAAGLAAAGSAAAGSAAAGAEELDRALAAVGDRWSLRIVAALLAASSPLRFGELQVAVDGIATNVLTQRLRHLEGVRVVVARPYSRRPVRAAYELTAAGRDLAGTLRLLTRWGADHAGGPTSGPRHGRCGTVLEVRWWCPTCDRPVDDPGEGPLRWA
jgi:DNA-binding HxlR family transcriptional regulator